MNEQEQAILAFAVCTVLIAPPSHLKYVMHFSCYHAFVLLARWWCREC